MIIKHAFLGVFHRFMAFCIAIFLGFANAFSANLPAGYTELEYIESTGTQYIDTGLTVKSNTLADFDYQYTDCDSTNYVFGQVSGAGGSIMGYRTTRIWWFSATNLSNACDLNKHTVSFASDGKVYQDGQVLATKGSFYETLSNTMKLFAELNDGGVINKGRVKIYNFTFKEGSTIVRNFVPAKNSSGVIGLYDTVSGTFFTNAGTGEFIAAPEVLNPCRNLYNKANGVLYGYPSQSFVWQQKTGPTAELSIMLKLTEGETYTVQRVAGAGTSAFRIQASSTETLTQGQQLVNIRSNSSANVQTFTVPNGAPYVIFYVRNVYNANGAANTSSLTLDQVIDGFQIEQGSTATEYVPYNASCHNTNSIKIATTAYNAARFSPVVTDLNSAVNTIKDVVTNTINQTAAVSALQSTKQTRPDEECPQYRQCLLVEDSSGTPHWYEILDPFYNLFAPILAQDITAGGTITSENPVPSTYTQIEYIESTGSQYVALPSFQNASNIDIITDVQHTDGTNEQIFLAPSSGIQCLYTVSSGWRVWKSGGTSNGGGATSLGDLYARHKFLIKTTSAGVEYYVDGSKINVQPSFTSSEFSGKSLNIGARTTSSGADFFWKGKIYSFKAICDGAVCMDLVPVRRNSDQSVGMYDTVTGSFTGTGTFGDGNAVSNQTASWSVTFTGNETGNNIVAGTVSGTAKCNALSANENTVATSAQLNNASWTEPGNNCWCVATLVDITNSVIANGDNWVLSSTNQNCDTTCANECATKTASGASTNTAFRHAIAGF